MARFTQEEFDEFLARNPQLSIQCGAPQKRTTAQVTIEKAAQRNIGSQTGLGANAGHPTAPKRKKYGNMRVAVLPDGAVVFESACIATGQAFPKGKLVFDSEKEYFRWKELEALQDAGFISGLELQKNLLILPSVTTPAGEKIRAVRYKADFYYARLDRTVVVEDVKARSKKTGKVILTQVFSLKWKLLKYRYPQYLFRIEA